jgi:hypothetical protein
VPMVSNRQGRMIIRPYLRKKMNGSRPGTD